MIHYSHKDFSCFFLKISSGKSVSPLLQFWRGYGVKMLQKKNAYTKYNAFFSQSLTIQDSGQNDGPHRE